MENIYLYKLSLTQNNRGLSLVLIGFWWQHKDSLILCDSEGGFGYWILCGDCDSCTDTVREQKLLFNLSPLFFLSL